MYALDFEYDGQYLSDFGFIVCNFNASSGKTTATAGSKITFNTVSRHRGNRYSLTGTQYNECIQSKFGICKNPDQYDDLEITNDEYRDLMRWLNRNKFLRFQVLSDAEGRDACFYDASFNIEKVLVAEKLYGLELTMETNRPFGYGAEQRTRLNFSDVNKKQSVMDLSDDIGTLFPNLHITCKADGNLQIINETFPCVLVIQNCKNGEEIDINGDTLIITSSRDDHEICNDFNFEFLKIGNTMDNRSNKISVSLPCILDITYSPIIKDAP